MISDAFKDEPTFRRCLRPNCQFGQVHERADAEPLMSCGDCGYKMCYVHQRPWHEGQTCSQYDYALSHREQWERENAASLALIESSFTACPQCGIRIEKNKGCDHMTCTHCRFEFCWQCLSPYEPIRQHGNTGHAASCRYHSANLPAMALLNPLQYFPDD
ncbi:hypothetical protein MMC18_003015 [Xylographa bjoerkii]|nr:hypothetical protein [Xylographa bjoerkii]